MIRILAAAAVLLTTAAPAQVTSYERNNPAPVVTGDPDRIVCKKEESLGTRLGARKVCLTVREWTEKAETHQEFTEKIQSSPRMHRE